MLVSLVSRSAFKRGIYTSKCLHMTFEGNSLGIQGSDEERMKNVFGGRIKGDPPKSSSRVLTHGSRLIAGVNVPAKPLEPDNCCMSGCVNCVWEIYNDDLRDWKQKRREAAHHLKNTHEIWPEDFDPPLKELDIQNVPERLKTVKIRLDKQKKRSTASLFPARTEPLPQAVIEAKKRNARRKEEASKTAEDDEEGWDNVPVFIRAFAEFEKKKKLSREAKKTQT